MTFCIRENDPYIGRVKLYFIPGGAFIATNKVVTERDFLLEVVAFLRRRHPDLLAEEKAESKPDAVSAVRESPLGEPRSVRCVDAPR